MIESAFLMFTGRGVIAILQGIIGLIYFIEGFWAAVKGDAREMKKFIVFIGFFSITSIAMSIINLETIDYYCSTAIADVYAKCEYGAKAYGYIQLIVGVFGAPVFAGVIICHYWDLQATALRSQPSYPYFTTLLPQTGTGLHFGTSSTHGST